MHGFVRVVVVVVPEEVVGSVLEEREQFLREVLAAHQPDQPGNIVRHEPALLVGIGLAASLAVHGLPLPLKPVAVLVLRPEPTHLLIPQVPIRLAPSIVDSRQFRLAQTLGKAREAPVGIGVLEGLGDAALPIRRVAQVSVAEPIHRVLAVGERSVNVVVANPLLIRVHNHRHGWIAEHAARVRIHDLPARQVAPSAQLCEL